MNSKIKFVVERGLVFQTISMCIGFVVGFILAPFIVGIKEGYNLLADCYKD